MDETLSDINIYWHECLNPFICVNIIKLVFPWSKGKLIFLTEKKYSIYITIHGHIAISNGKKILLKPVNSIW